MWDKVAKGAYIVSKMRKEKRSEAEQYPLTVEDNLKSLDLRSPGEKYPLTIGKYYPLNIEELEIKTNYDLVKRLEEIQEGSDNVFVYDTNRITESLREENEKLKKENETLKTENIELSKKLNKRFKSVHTYNEFNVSINNMQEPISLVQDTLNNTEVARIQTSDEELNKFYADLLTYVLNETYEGEKSK